jgi:hypothetical protein
MEFEKNKRQKPRSGPLAGIMLLRGLLLGYSFFTTWQVINDPIYQDVLPAWLKPYVILIGVLAMLCLVSAVLIFMYKRYGLMTAITVSGVDLVVGVLLVAMGQLQPNVPGFVVAGLALYLSYKFLNEEPHSAFFT